MLPSHFAIKHYILLLFECKVWRPAACSKFYPLNVLTVLSKIMEKAVYCQMDIV